MTEAQDQYWDSPIGRIPKEWDVVRLGDYAYIKARIGWRGLSASEYTKEGPFLIAGQHIEGSKIRWDRCDHISEYRYEESHEIILEENDIIISKDGTLGRLGFIENLPGNATINGTMMLIRSLNKKQLNPKFLYYYFQGKNFQQLIKEKVSGSSVPHIFQRDLVNFKIPLIPFKEQQKIAAILSKVDVALADSDDIIAKIEEIKQGLMQRIFTNGIGHTEFKESKIGRIPSTWGLKKIDDIKANRPHSISMGPFGSDITVDNFIEKGIPVLRGINLSGIYVNINNCVFISPKKADELLFCNAYPRDIVITHRGTIGQVSLIQEEANYDRFVVSQSQMKLSCDESIVNPFYVNFYLNSPLGQKLLLNYKAHTGVPAIGQPVTSLKSIFVPIPPIEEQLKIISILSTVFERISIEYRYRSHLDTLKKDLMQVLLTGQKRVKVEAEVPANA